MRRRKEKKHTYLGIIGSPHLTSSRFNSLSTPVSPKPQHARHSSDITNFLRFGTPSDTIVHVPLSVARLNSRAQQDLTKRSYNFEKLLHPQQPRAGETPPLENQHEFLNSIKSVTLPIKNFSQVSRPRMAFCISPNELSDSERIRLDIMRRVRTTPSLEDRPALVSPACKDNFLQSFENTKDRAAGLIEMAKRQSTFESFSNPYAQTFFEAIKGRDTTAVVQLLALDKKLVSVKDSIGQTALHWAAKRNDLQMAKTLKAAGADINATDMTLRTPLFVAARKDLPDMVSFLLESGATRTIASISGSTPADVAKAGSLVHALLHRRNLSSNVVMSVLLGSMKRKTNPPKPPSNT